MYNILSLFSSAILKFYLFATDLMNYIYNLIDLCKRVDVKYHQQSIVILESKPVEIKDKQSFNFFECNTIVHILAVERPLARGQLYVANGLSYKNHFSCPTSFLPSLVNAIQQSNNKTFNLLFIPRSTVYFKNDMIAICNDISISPMFQEDDAKRVYDDFC